MLSVLLTLATSVSLLLSAPGAPVDEPKVVCGEGTLVPCYNLPALDWPVWDALAECESNHRWSIAGRYSGGLQINSGTWKVFGGREFAAQPYLATREEQIEIARRILDSGGWSQWPTCSRKLGYRG